MGQPNPEGQGRLMEQVIVRGLCVRCGACVGICPYFDYFDGRLVVMDPCQAGDTFRCLNVCPRAVSGQASPPGNERTDDVGAYREIWMARAVDDEIRERSQYGGVVSALILYALEKDIISAAILTDRGGPFAPEGRLANRRAHVLDCAGSRYTPSGSLSVLNRAIQQGYSRLGVVGLPCQMEALARMERIQPNGKEKTEAISLRIGLFCTWAVDYCRLKTYLREHGVVNPILKSDIPPPPAEVFQVKTWAGWMDLPLSDIRSMIQEGCSLCEDMTAQQSDISVGTAEGHLGWNTVIVRNDSGAGLLKGAVQEGWIETADLPFQNLEHLKEAAQNKRRRARQAIIDRSGPHE